MEESFPGREALDVGGAGAERPRLHLSASLPQDRDIRRKPCRPWDPSPQLFCPVTEDLASPLGTHGNGRDILARSSLPELVSAEWRSSPVMVTQCQGHGPACHMAHYEVTAQQPCSKGLSFTGEAGDLIPFPGNTDDTSVQPSRGHFCPLGQQNSRTQLCEGPHGDQASFLLTPK